MYLANSGLMSLDPLLLQELRMKKHDKTKMLRINRFFFILKSFESVTDDCVLNQTNSQIYENNQYVRILCYYYLFHLLFQILYKSRSDIVIKQTYTG